MRDLLRGCAERGRTVLVSSHLLAEMELLADDLVVIAGGRLVTSSSLADLQQAEISVRTPSRDVLVTALQGGGTDVSVDAPVEAPDTLVVRGMSIERVGACAFAAGVELHELTARVGSLEERFLAWTSTTPPNDGGSST